MKNILRSKRQLKKNIDTVKLPSLISLAYMNKTERDQGFIDVILMSSIVLVGSFFVISTQLPLQYVAAQEEEEEKEPAVGETIAWRGTLTSSVDPLKGHEGHQATVILPPRNDSALYSGVLTYTASKPVQVVVVQIYDLDNATTAKIPDKFGTILTSPAPWNKGETVTPLMMSIDYLNSPTLSKTVPFVGNVLGLHTMDGEPFIATYSVVADIIQPKVVNNIESAMTNSTIS